MFMALAQATDHKRMIMGGDCYNYAMLASGHLDIVCEAGLATGSGVGPTQTTTSGTIAFTSPDGVSSVSLGGNVLSSDSATAEDIAKQLRSAIGEGR